MSDRVSLIRPFGGVMSEFELLAQDLLEKAEAEERQMAVLQQAQQAEQSALQHLPPQQGINSNQSQTFPSIATPQMTMTPQELMAMKQKLYGGGLTSPMDQDFMAMTSGINRLNYLG